MIYLIITASINNKHGVVNDTHRKNTYIKAITSTLNLIKDMNIRPIIVENNGFRSTYLDNLGCDVVYTDNNSLQTPHKGVNELQDIKDVIEKYKIQDNDMVIKLTGRYTPLRDTFFKIVIDSQGDALVKFYNVCELKYMTGDCVLGLLAIRSKYLKEFNYECKFSPEVEFARFVKSSGCSFEEVINLDLRCCFADNLRLLDV
jgi:hypothetical protein